MMISRARAAIPNKARWAKSTTTGRPAIMMSAQLRLADGRGSGLRPRCIGYSRGGCSSSIDQRDGIKYTPTARMSTIFNNKPSSQSQRCFSSSTVSTKSKTQIFQYGNDEDRIHFSKLKPRQSAELEDELFSRINSTNNNDDRLKDPILGKFISRKGLDWIRSVSLPSSFSFDDDEVINSHDKDSITVIIQTPTLLHPKLADIASNVAHVVQEEMVALIRNQQRSEWFTFTTKGDNQLKLHPKDIGVTIKIHPRETNQSSPSNKDITNQGKALQNITHFLAVYSCKGGVGKSTIAANLAYQLSSMGGLVGLLDLDVYGPSLPLLVRPDDPTVRQSPPDDEGGSTGMVEPIEHEGVKLMSLGYVSPTSGVPGSGPNGGAAVLRGPMAGRVVAQLLKGTNWGHLDVLVLDLPPGTGDVQLEVCQSLSLSGAVAVSTPSSLAWADVRKGVQMFGEMGVSTLALVENMAYFVCEGGGRHYPFGKARASMTEEEEESSGESSSSSALAAHFLPGSSHVFHLPISSTVNDSNDSGTPLCCESSSSNAEEELATFSKLADAISTDLLLVQHKISPLSARGSNGGSGNSNGNKNVLTVMVDEAGDDSEFDVPFTQLSVDNDHKNFTVRLFSNEGGYQKVISGRDLRSRDPRTGEEEEKDTASSGEQEEAPMTSSGCGGGSGAQKLSSMVHHHTAACGHDHSDEKDDGLFPAKITKKGNYGYEVEWADGATIIYSLLAIAKSAGGKPLESQ
mmetsp:Transcript_10991/g.19436  ORF Transcript_10991/g.19436 Transcript_10991/m.19436 type:complete len:742 (+) Transcript_10991:285-2510(+)